MRYQGGGNLMEFTLSRASLMICGVILLTATVSPVADFLQDENDGYLQELAEKDARLLDALVESGYDEVFLHGDSFLPSAEYSLRVDGYLLTIQAPDGAERTAALRNQLVPMEISYCTESEISPGDMLCPSTE